MQLNKNVVRQAILQTGGWLSVSLAGLCWSLSVIPWAIPALVTLALILWYQAGS